MTTIDSNYDAGVYIDPLSDWGWKTLFGSDRYKEHLISFINAVYPELGVTDISYQNNEDMGDSFFSRSSRFDLVCDTDKGETVMVEVQKAEQTYFYEREIWTSSFKIRDQAPRGDWDYHLKGVYSIGIVNFEPEKIEGYSWDDDEFLHSFTLREDRDFQPMTNLLRFSFIAVKKFHKKVEELDNILEKWVYLFGNMKRLENRPKELQDRVFESFFRAAEIAKLPTKELQIYRNSIMNENDWKNAINHAAELAEEKGREEERMKNAKGFLSQGVPAETIAKVTGLSVDQVLELK